MAKTKAPKKTPEDLTAGMPFDAAPLSEWLGAQLKSARGKKRGRLLLQVLQAYGHSEYLRGHQQAIQVDQKLLAQIQDASQKNASAHASMKSMEATHLAMMLAPQLAPFGMPCGLPGPGYRPR